VSWWKDNLERLIANDSDAQNEFLDAYLPIFRSWILKITKDVDEHLTDTVMHVFGALPRFEFQRSHSIDGWLKVVLGNYVLGRLRRRRKPWSLDARGNDGEDFSREIRDETAINPAGSRQPPFDLLQRALADLSPFDRLLLFVVKVKRVTQREVAELLGETIVWVNRRVNSRLDQLEVRIEELLAGELSAKSRASRRGPTPAASHVLDTRFARQLDLLIAFCVDRKGYHLPELAVAAGWTMVELLERIDRMRDGYQHRSMSRHCHQEEGRVPEEFQR
jgi:RNA polymerase sigma factor (sigma-70 family)